MFQVACNFILTTENRSLFFLLFSSSKVEFIQIYGTEDMSPFEWFNTVLEEAMKEDCGQANDLQPFMFNMRNCKEHMVRNECFCAVQHNTSFDLTAG